MKSVVRALMLILFSYSSMLFAQVKGTITDPEGQPLPYVNVYIENSFNGTISNAQGYYYLDTADQTSVTVVYQFLGFKTQKKTLSIAGDELVVDVVLEEEQYSLDAVYLSTAENPAHRIIRKAIAQRKINLDKTAAFTADFYSRGIWRMEDVPEKILGVQVGDLEGALDTTRSGIVYLSETVSKIAYQRPNHFKEHIIASKVSGNDNGFSFNSAEEAEFNFYENTLEINTHLVSPIASDAFGYYEYALEGVFYEENQLVNKIKVTPKRANDRVFSGYIYIVEDSWQLLGVELKATGHAIQVPFVDEINLIQNFSYDDSLERWVKISQTIDFGFAILGMKGYGKFTAFYSNYDFKPDFGERYFTSEVLRIDPEANLKDSIYWRSLRPVPLTIEEAQDYLKKDSIQQVRKSKHYLDSLDRVNNRFQLLSPITGYTYTQSYNRQSFSYSGLLRALSFNTIQGMSLQGNFSYRQWSDEHFVSLLQAGLTVNYGVAEEKLRMYGHISKRFNRTNRRTIQLSGGSKLEQFNSDNPISPMLNSITSLYFKRNHLKAYQLYFARISYSEEVINGLKISAQLGYEKRQSLFNHSHRYFIAWEDREYTSNNPLLPLHHLSSPFIDHNIVKFHLQGEINFGQKYLSYPYARFTIPNHRFPTLTLAYEKGMGATEKQYNYDQFKIAVKQEVNMRNKGAFNYHLKAGTFINGENIAFMDYQHFNGNQTRIGTAANYTQVFNLLPYYQWSTNASYFEGHIEHDFKGYILGKVPLLNKLNYNLVVGAHLLSTQNRKPYSELSVGMDNVGFGKFRFFRIDYVHSFYENHHHGAFIFGLKFLQLLD